MLNTLKRMSRPVFMLVCFMVLYPGLISAAMATDDNLIIYSGRSDKFVLPVMEKFTEATGIKVILHSASSTALLNKLRLEGSRTQADAFLSNDAGSLQIGEEMGVFGVIPTRITNIIRPDLRSPTQQWLGLSARARALVVNTDYLKSHTVNSVFDLADPDLKGRLAITNSSNESFIAGTTVYQLAAGEEKTRHWLQGLKDNSAGDVFNKHSSIVAAVASGKKDVGLVNHYYIYRYLDEHPQAPIRIVVPDQQADHIGLAWNVAGIAISKYSKKQAQLEKLLSFLVSKEGQRLFSELNREYPARTDVMTDHSIPPLSTLKIADVPMYQLGRHRNQTLDLIEAVGMP
jgi:iron(III) transport system substrate-binding protein